MHVRTADRTLEFDVRVAEASDDQARGLQGVEALPEGTGMLFLFVTERSGGFWMRDTLVPLDIAFVDARGRIVAVERMVPCPGDPCPLTDPGVPYRAALETATGALAGVAPGDVVTWDALRGRYRPWEVPGGFAMGRQAWQVAVTAAVVALPLVLLLVGHRHRERLDARGRPLQRRWRPS